MKLKFWSAKRKARHLAAQARSERRALRDHQRQQLRSIRAAEIRARGLRLFVAWAERSNQANRHELVADWHAPLPRTV